MMCSSLLYNKVFHTHTHIYIENIQYRYNIYIVFHILYHYGLSQDTEYSFCATQLGLVVKFTCLTPQFYSCIHL